MLTNNFAYGSADDKQKITGNAREEWKWMTLGEIAYYPKNRVSIKDIKYYVGVENLQKEKGGVMFSSEKPQVDSVIKFEPNDILIGNIRPYLKKIWFSDKEGGTNGDVVLVRIKNDFNKSICYKFLFYLLSSDNFSNMTINLQKVQKCLVEIRSVFLIIKFPFHPSPSSSALSLSSTSSRHWSATSLKVCRQRLLHRKSGMSITETSCCGLRGAIDN